MLGDVLTPFRLVSAKFGPVLSDVNVRAYFFDCTASASGSRFAPSSAAERRKAPAGERATNSRLGKKQRQLALFWPKLALFWSKLAPSILIWEFKASS